MLLLYIADIYKFKPVIILIVVIVKHICNQNK